MDIVTSLTGVRSPSAIALMLQMKPAPTSLKSGPLRRCFLNDLLCSSGTKIFLNCHPFASVSVHSRGQGFAFARIFATEIGEHLAVGVAQD